MMLTEALRPDDLNKDVSITHIHDITQLRLYWKQLTHKAHDYYKASSYQQAATTFNQCVEISKRLLSRLNTRHQQAKDESSDIERLYFASHNLAACQNVMHKACAAEQTLKSVYDEIINLSQNESTPYDTKLELLACLDKCVFSLASQYAYLGKVDSVHELIIEAEKFGEVQLTNLALGDSN